MKYLILLSAIITSTGFAKTTYTECSFKKNLKNKIYLDFNYNGHNLDTAKVLLILQAGGKGKDFTYYNYAFMQEAMSYQAYIPYGRRAEVVNFVDKLELNGAYNFRVVNYGATQSSVEFASVPKSRRNLSPELGFRRIGFEAVVKTILKTENIIALENGKELSVNEVSCVQKIN